MNNQYTEILDKAAEAAETAADIIRGLMNRAKIESKGLNNLVTEADIQAEKAIRKIILGRFPDHSILGEEGGGEQNTDAPHLWIVDPLDGTNNFAHGFPFFSVSIAYAENGEVKAGFVLDVVRNEAFRAVKGGGAWLDGEKIKVSDRRLDEALVTVGFYYDRGDMMRSTLQALQRLFENNIRGLRRTGSAALDMCYIAAGRTDAFVEYRLHPWDFAASMLILREAGGECRNASGEPLGLEDRSVAVCNGVFTKRLIELVRYPCEV